ncbi:MAG TPA: ubiquinol-cytochrome c reductase iron-sulfur subunit, partial [Bryobacteraceae bacterium]
MNLVQSPEAQGISRRNFYVGAIYGMWAAIGAALGLPALVYLFFPPKARHEEEWVEVGDVSKLAVGSPVEMTFRRNRIDGWKVTSENSTAWVVKQPDNRIV